MGTAPQCVRVMAEYRSTGICRVWTEASPEVGMVDFADLPITAALRRAFEEWIERYDATLDWDSPADTEEQPAEFWADFDAQGRALTQQLATEMARHGIRVEPYVE